MCPDLSRQALLHLIRCCQAVPGGDPHRAPLSRVICGPGEGTQAMTVPYDQQLRREQFTEHHPEWAIHAQDEATRYTAEKRDGPTRHIVAHASLKVLLDRLDEIVAGR